MNEKKRTIVVVAPYFPPAAGGLERYALEIAELLQNEHNSRIVVITSGEKGKNDVCEEKHGFTIYRLGYAFKASNTPISLSWIWKVRRILKNESPDIVHIHTPVPGIGDIASFFSKAPVVVTYHASSMKKGKFLVDIVASVYETFALPILLRKASKIICASEFIRDGFLKAYQYKSVTLTPGVHSENFVPNSFLKTKLPTILFVAGRIGRTDTYKGVDTLLDAMVMVSKKIPDARLVIVGDGDMLSEYEARAERTIPGVVTFTGTLHGNMLVAEFQKAHILAHPSRNESFGMVILEAMASGIPVVASNVGGIPGLLENTKTGFLVPPGNAEVLAEKLIAVMADPMLAKAMGNAGRNRAIEKYSWEERARAYDKLFESLMRPLIVHAVGYYPPHIGGMERVTETISELLSKENWRVLVLTSNGVFRGKTERKGNLIIRRLASFEFAHTPIAPGLLFQLFLLPKRSIVHLHLSQAFWPELVLLVSKLRGIPYIAHLHLDVAPSGSLGQLFLVYKKIMWKRILSSATKVIACSDDLGELAKREYGVASHNIEIIPNAVGDSFFATRTYAVPNDKFRLLSIGRLAHQKKTARLIEMMEHLLIPVELTIAGDGEERESLEALAKQKNLSNVHFVGSKNDAEMRALHAESDAFLIASDREGRSLAVLEAMAAGLPIIASDVEGNRELVGSVGILVSPPTPLAFAAAVEKLWTEKQSLIALSEKSSAKAKENTWGSFISRLNAMYTALITPLV